MPTDTKHIAIIGFNGTQVLDVTGPMQVFASANEELGTAAYETVLLGLDGATVRASCGLVMQAKPLAEADPQDFEMVLVVGGEPADVGRMAASPVLQAWLKNAATTAERICSVCTGTFALAASGVADGRRVATHWRAATILQARYPALKVDGEALYVEDGNLWTSAGVTAGIDMALALVERDHGRAVAMAIARRLVVFARRPGNQSQFSALLEGQSRASNWVRETSVWMAENIKQPITVADAAACAGMSERTFHRKFVSETGETPARYLEKLRLEAARALLETGDMPLKAVAGDVGLGTPIRLIQAFERRFGLSPTAYRRLHGAGATP